MMARYIDAEVLKSRLEDFSRWCKDGRKEGVDFVLNCPLPDTDTADVQEIRHGRWIRDSHNIVCSVCGGKRPFKKKKPIMYKTKPTIHKQGYYVSSNSRFCPHCGAKLDGKEAEAKIKEIGEKK